MSDCECVGYTIRTDYGTGVEYDIDRSSCPVHCPPDEWEWCTDDCPEDCVADHKGEE